MSSRTSTRVTRVSPNADERQIIALLMLTGQQFDEFKSLLVSNSRLHSVTVYSAAKTLQKYLAMSDYVPFAERCLVMEIALMYASQFKKLIAELGQKVVDSIGEMSEAQAKEQDKKYNNRNWLQECNFMHTIFRTGSRKPIEKGTLSYIALESAMIALSQPHHEEFLLVEEQTWISHKEEPVLPTAPIIRPSRSRCYSMVLIEDYSAKRLRTNAYKAAMRAIGEEEDSNIQDDIAFDETIEPRFIHYCRAEDIPNGERWACSRNLRNRLTGNEESNDSLIHEKCLDETLNDQSYFLAIKSSAVNRMTKRKFFREFTPIMNPFGKEHNLI